jgi:chemotaxis signal transduction protein
MADRIVVFRVGGHMLSLPFNHVDEILGTDRAVPRTGIPDGVIPEGDTHSLWVSSKGRWLPVRGLLPGQGRDERSQIIVVTCEGSNCAVFVDHVLGIEDVDPLIPFPDAARPYTEIPFAGVRFLKDQPVLELDLSRTFSLDIGSVNGG